MKKYLIAGAMLASFGGAAQAADCTVEGEAFDLTPDQVGAVYDCIEAEMAERYARKDHPVGVAYRDWQVTSTRPEIPGAHTERFLQTFANDIAAEQYLKFEEEGFVMPAGSVLAKESFRVKDGKAIVGPLFIMTKLEDGAAPEHGDWNYEMMLPTGVVMTTISQGACSSCHLGWDYRDSLAYPVEEVRVSN